MSHNPVKAAGIRAKLTLPSVSPDTNKHYCWITTVVNDTAEHYSVDWSVIVIARNEEKSIAECLQSVIAAFTLHSYELIFVDSASEDRTVEIARQFPAKIIHLPDTLPKRPSIAREAGRLQAKGRWILFLDGDCTLLPAWLPAAKQALLAENLLAGVAGKREEIIADSSELQKCGQHTSGTQKTVTSLGGCAAYKHDIVKKVGGFNTSLYSCEEAEFGARIRKAGYRLSRLPEFMTRHYMKHQHETSSEILRRIRRGFPIGMGQIVRHVKHYHLPIQGSLREISKHLQFWGLLGIGLMVFTTSIITGNWIFFSGWLLFLLAVFILFSVKTRSISKPAYYFFEWASTGPFIFWGLLQTPRQRSDFDEQLLRVEIENPDL